MRVLLHLPRDATRAFRLAPLCALAVVGLALLVPAGCNGTKSSEDTTAADAAVVTRSSLERIRETGVLRVATRNAPTMFYYDRHDETAGPEVELTRRFAESLGVRVEFDLHHSVADVLAAIDSGSADLAAAGLNATINRAGEFLFGPTYQEVHPQVVCRRGGASPGSLHELADRSLSLAVVAESSYVEELNLRKPGTPGLEWSEVADASTEQLLEQVWNEAIDCTVADSNIVAVNRRYYPELEVAFDLDDPQPLVWLLSSESEDLRATADDWLGTFRESGGLDEWHEQFYSAVSTFDFVDIRAFHQRLGDRYPKYREMFVESAGRHGVSWTVLSAQSYQESHWNPRAKSPTGVRGIMMLTQTTAKTVGVTNRLDAPSNIEGGARYLARLERQLDDSIVEPDRSYLALAAYNVGMGHLKDAQTLAVRLDRDPHSWSDLKLILPLLKQKQYYSTVRYGYARGTEPVRYVERIRNYTDILERQLDILR